MPMHDWTRVAAGIFHAFHHEWISELGRALNRALPDDYYALPEQQAAGFGPDVLTLKIDTSEGNGPRSEGGVATAVHTKPQTRFTAETATEFYQRKKSSSAIGRNLRHCVSGDAAAMAVGVGIVTHEDVKAANLGSHCGRYLF